MAIYLSIDTEATGLAEGNFLIQLAMVPVDSKTKRVYEELGKETLVHCPSYEELEPKLDSWNKEHNGGLIRAAHERGIPAEQVKTFVATYLKIPQVAELFRNDRPVLLGKSLSALDIPLLKRYMGWNLYDSTFHHHTMDLTCFARGLVDSGKLPENCSSSSKLIKHFGIRDNVKHTALSDAVDMAHIYLRLVDLLLPKPQPQPQA